jgi:hypothetical protein
MCIVQSESLFGVFSMRALICLSLCFSVFVSGCASIICGSEKTVSVNSNPSGASYAIENASGHIVDKGITPSTLSLKRGRGWFKSADYKITLSKEGCKPMTFPIRQGLNAGWYLGGNLIFGGFFGWLIIDPLTGAMWDIQNVHVNLLCD